MSVLEGKLKAMGYVLPPPRTFPKDNRTGCIQHGNLLLVGGHGLDLPQLPKVRQTGKFGLDISVEEGYATARAVALTMLATLKQHTGGNLDRIGRCLRIFGMCNSTGDFAQQSAVIDGASDLFFGLFGSPHSRTAVGLSALPHGIALEINGEFELAAPFTFPVPV